MSARVIMSLILEFVPFDALASHFIFIEFHIIVDRSPSPKFHFHFTRFHRYSHQNVMPIYRFYYFERACFAASSLFHAYFSSFRANYSITVNLLTAAEPASSCIRQAALYDEAVSPPGFDCAMHDSDASLAILLLRRRVYRLTLGQLFQRICATISLSAG